MSKDDLFGDREKGVGRKSGVRGGAQDFAGDVLRHLVLAELMHRQAGDDLFRAFRKNGDGALQGVGQRALDFLALGSRGVRIDDVELGNGRGEIQQRRWNGRGKRGLGNSRGHCPCMEWSW